MKTIPVLLTLALALSVAPMVHAKSPDELRALDAKDDVAAGIAGDADEAYGHDAEPEGKKAFQGVVIMDAKVKTRGRLYLFTKIDDGKWVQEKDSYDVVAHDATVDVTPALRQVIINWTGGARVRILVRVISLEEYKEGLKKGGYDLPVIKFKK
ncbi:MAG: hypothetical protein RLZZ324_279 [Candidatus Parcubacteria bacterium]|jgi:hypothetical protein